MRGALDPRLYPPPAYEAPPGYPVGARRAMFADVLTNISDVIAGRAPSSPHMNRMAAAHLYAQQNALALQDLDMQRQAAADDRYEIREADDRLYRIDRRTGATEPLTDAPAGGAGMFEGTSMPAQLFNMLQSRDPSRRALAFSELTKPRTVTTPTGTYTMPGTDPNALNGIVQAAGFEPFGQQGPTSGDAGAGGAGDPAAAPAGFTPAPPTEAQARAYQHFSQMTGAYSQMHDLLQDPNFDAAGSSFVTSLMQADGSISTLANFAASPEEQSFARAAERFIRAKLRLESGAVIGAEEAKNEYRAFFPMPGDSERTLREKSLARYRTLRTLGQTAGRAYDALDPIDQVYEMDEGRIVTREDILATAEAEGITPQEALQRALEAGTIRPLLGTGG